MGFHLLHFYMASPKSIYPICTPIFYNFPKIYLPYLFLLLTKGFTHFSLLWPPENLYILNLPPPAKTHFSVKPNPLCVFPKICVPYLCLLQSNYPPTNAINMSQPHQPALKRCYSLLITSCWNTPIAHLPQSTFHKTP